MEAAVSWYHVLKRFTMPSQSFWLTPFGGTQVPSSRMAVTQPLSSNIRYERVR